MSWLYKGQIFKEDMIPEGAVGFIYEMEAIIDGKPVRYVGKKNFFSKRKKKFGKKALAAMLKKAHKKGIPIKRFIIKICYTKTELTYQETKHQFVQEVLEKEEYLNANILGRFYKQK
jgi:hypothetical protein